MVPLGQRGDVRVGELQAELVVAEERQVVQVAVPMRTWSSMRRTLAWAMSGWSTISTPASIKRPYQCRKAAAG